MKLKKVDISGAFTPPERLSTLADGVFAIVMTLLVLELSVPVVKGLSSNSELLHKLAEMWPEFMIYGLSFMILGVFWVIHHSIYADVKRYDTTLVWLNIVFLMFVSLIPFSTALVGKNGFIKVTAVIYGVNMLFLFNLGWATFAFTTGKRRLSQSRFSIPKYLLSSMPFLFFLSSYSRCLEKGRWPCSCPSLPDQKRRGKPDKKDS